MRRHRPLHLSAARAARRGVSLVAAALLMTALSGLTIAALMMSNSALSEQVATRADLSARYAADAALAVAVTRLNNEGPGVLAELQQPTDMGGVTFWVEAETSPDGLTSLVATGQAGLMRYRQQLVVRRQPRSMFSFGAFGEEHLELASNAQVDSYRSNDGTYEDQEVNGSGQSAWAGDRGNIGSNREILLRQNARAYGDAQPGPSSVVTIMGNAFVTGTTLPAGEQIVLPELEVPVFPTSGSLSTARGGDVSLPSGNYSFTDSVIGTGSVLKVTGPAKVVFDSLIINQNSQVVIDGSRGMVEFFVRDDFVMGSNTSIASVSRNPAEFALNLESDNIIEPNLAVDLDEIDFESNSKLYGTIFAPNAYVIINSNFQLYGSIVARRLRLDSNSQVHYDEDLLENREQEQAPLEVIGWRVLPRRAPKEQPAGEDGGQGTAPDGTTGTGPTGTDPTNIDGTTRGLTGDTTQY